MSATPTSQISASDWLDIRDEVARRLKSKTSGQLATCITQAEHLLRSGLIDIDAVNEALHPAPKPDPTERDDEE